MIRGRFSAVAITLVTDYDIRCHVNDNGSSYEEQKARKDTVNIARLATISGNYCEYFSNGTRVANLTYL